MDLFKELGEALKPEVCPSHKKMCKYCTIYKAVTRSKSGVILQGKCIEKNKMVWRDDYCSAFIYNGK